MQKTIVLTLVLVLFVAGCSGQQAKPTPTPQAQIIPAVVSASGKLLPPRWANLSFLDGGRVVEVKVQAGDTLNANATILTLIDPQALEVEASVAERDLALVQADQVAQLLFDAQPDLTARGHVERIVPSRLSGSQALYPVYLTFDQLPGGLAADMSVDISITIAGKANVLRLPRAVVRAKPDNTAQVSVWVEDHIEPRSIKTGLRGDVYVEIVEGLNEGDLVVSE